MKKILLIVSLLMTGATTIYAQKYMTRTGKISFNASAPGSPEKVEAVNNEVASVMDIKSGEIVFQALIKSFKFERELMQEHFNENYMESDKYPKADFKGNITNLSEINFGKSGNYNAKVTGKLTIHGVTNDVTVTGTISVKGNTVNITAKFSVPLKDYRISIPGVVADKVNKVATISLESDLIQK